MSDTGDDFAYGYAAYHAGAELSECPYGDKTPSGIAWARGFHAASLSGPPNPAAASAEIHQEVAVDKAVRRLREAAIGYIEMMRTYIGEPGRPVSDAKLYEYLLDFIEESIGGDYAEPPPRSEGEGEGGAG
jgi:hypothetical protein